jgi:hypothetical protein|tara:strand:+ start:800 stop:1174 length:375 start_codon:yes stop_codon:yes gene_type:complete
MSILGALIGPIATLGKTWIEGKNIKTKAKAEAEASVMKTQAKSAADWETAMARASNQSWKDEWLTILFSIPLVLAFVPSAVPYVREGFNVLATMPDWYQTGLSIIIAASFGVRGAIGIMNKVKK